MPSIGFEGPSERRLMRRFGGLNVDRPGNQLLDDECQDCLNVDLSSTGALSVLSGRATHNPAPLGNAVLSCGRVYWRDGSASFLADANDGVLYDDRDMDGAFEARAMGMSATARWRTAVFHDRAFRCNGTDAPLYYNRSTLSYFNWGIAAPAFALSAGAEGSGSFGASIGYKYRAAYAGSEHGDRSNPAPVEASVGPFAGAASVQLSGFAASPDPQADRIHLYRTLDGGSVHHFLADLPGDAVSYNDAAPDAAIATSESLETDNFPAPAAAFAALHKGRLFLARSEDGPSRLWWSKAGRPAEFPLDLEYLDIAPDDGQKITGVVPFGAQLLVFKDRALYAVAGSDPYEFDYVSIDARAGCVAPDSIVEADGSVLWLSQDGVLRYDGSSVQNLSAGSVNSALFAPGLSSLAGAAAVFHRRRFRLSCPAVAGGPNAREFIFHFDYPGRGSRWTLSDRGYNAYAVFGQDDGELYAGSAVSGSVYLEDSGTGDDGAPVPFRWKSRDFDFDDGSLEKAMLEKTVGLSSGADPVTLTTEVDFGDYVEEDVFTPRPRNNWDGAWDGSWSGPGTQWFTENFGAAAIGKCVNFTFSSEGTASRMDLVSLGLEFQFEEGVIST